MSKCETRRGEIRAADVDGRPGVTLQVIRPHVVDDYGTVWLPDTFDQALAERGPTLCWSHRWDEPLGPMVGYRSGPDGPAIDFAFSDFDAVPMAKRAHAQVQDGTIGDCSVGFVRQEWREATADDRAKYGAEAREVMTRASLDEVSLVLRGAVPGAKVLAVRSASTVDLDAVLELARRKVDGEITEEQARVALELLAEAQPEVPAPAPAESGEEPAPVADVEQAIDIDQAIDAALEQLGRSTKWVEDRHA